jgi:hypothetical protein
VRPWQWACSRTRAYDGEHRPQLANRAHVREDEAVVGATGRFRLLGEDVAEFGPERPHLGRVGEAHGNGLQWKVVVSRPLVLCRSRRDRAIKVDDSHMMARGITLAFPYIRRYCSRQFHKTRHKGQRCGLWGANSATCGRGNETARGNYHGPAVATASSCSRTRTCVREERPLFATSACAGKGVLCSRAGTSVRTPASW